MKMDIFIYSKIFILYINFPILYILEFRFQKKSLSFIKEYTFKFLHNSIFEKKSTSHLNIQLSHYLFSWVILKSGLLQLSTSCFNATDSSEPRLRRFWFMVIHLGFTFNAWQAISGDILHVSKWIQANTSWFTWRNQVNSFYIFILR